MRVGDVLRLVPCVVTFDGIVENAIKCVRVDGGIDTCTVAFVPRTQSGLAHVQAQLYKFVQVTELYYESPNSYKRSKSAANYGAAAVECLDKDHGRDE